MSARTLLLRSLRLVALLVQVALPSLGVVADARLELEALAQTTHVEAETHECDSRGHPPDCAICQYLRGAVLSAESRVFAFSGIVSSPLRHADYSPVPAGQRTLLRARGPPRLS
jgi:hypothetical protein